MEMTQFQKDFVRMADSIRKTNKGEMSCDGVDCCACPIRNVCASMRIGRRMLYVEDIMKAVSEWAKEHPFVTMKDKYKEVFGVEPKTKDGDYLCPHAAGFYDVECKIGRCGADCRNEFWQSEYKEPKKEVSK